MANSSDIPRPESIEFFESAIKNHKNIIRLEKKDKFYYSLHLTSGRKYKIYVTNIYTVGIAELIDLVNSHEIDAIVTISVWNGYTFEAKEYSQNIGKGLFLFNELMGAINFEKPEMYFSGYDEEGEKYYQGVRNS